MWSIEPSTEWQKDHDWYAKKRPDELAAVTANLKRYLALLNVSKNSKCVQAGYLHHEPMGVIAIDQKGFAGNLKETRLYTYSVDETKIVYLITIGDKDEQHSNIEFCKDFVKCITTAAIPNPAPTEKQT
jgi:hypothetical protein